MAPSDRARPCGAAIAALPACHRRAGADVTGGPIPAHLLPDTATVHEGRLAIGGVDVVELAAKYGTPLFVYDEEHLRNRCREAVAAFGDGVVYATKAFLSQGMAKLAWEEGLHLDVATGGELHVALAAGVPADRLVMHGNNKSVPELEMAISAGVGRIVLDSFDEIRRIEDLVAAGLTAPRVLVRVNPGVDAHTHEYLQTGIADSKFGFGISSGDAGAAIGAANLSPAMDLVGIHAHIGSQVFVADSYSKAIGALAPFLAEHRLDELSIGGGLGVAYVVGESAPTITEWASSVTAACREHGIEARITAEPGRSIVASAAVTLYTVGTIKDIDDIRTYVAVDGGMSDNPRPVLYGSGYEAFLPRAVGSDRTKPVRIVGKHCESGDVIVSEAMIPADTTVGDILCTPVTGAYGHSMGSNYNMVLRPPVVFVCDGEARLVIRRETFADLTNRDVVAD
ncbi:MAG: diaminopimelate decarboxylase [bacterium]|nr:diaminopimelate decarboxylase [bacterium]